MTMTTVNLTSTTSTATTIAGTERRARESALIAHLADMVHVGSAEVGIDEVLASARRGNGRLLVVQADSSSHDVEHPVQEVIDLVEASGGAVEFVAAGSLVDIGGIGLVIGRST